MQSAKIKWNYKNIPYGTDARQKFDMACRKKDANAIVYIHGGAYFTGSKLQYPSFLADFSENNLIASMDYRVITVDNTIRLGDILSDVANALAKIIELSNENGITIKSFTLIGHSAGGHIGLLYGYKYFQNNENTKITACVSLAGPTDFSDDIGWSSMEMWGGSMKERLAFFSWMGSRLTGNTIELAQHNWTKQKNYPQFKKHIENISPVMYASQMKNLPPTLLVHGRGDNQVPYSNSVRLKATLNDTSVPHKLISLGGRCGDHLLGGKVISVDEPVLYENKIWVNEAKEWMGAYLL